MKDLIQLKARNEEYNYLIKIKRVDNKESYTYLLRSSSSIKTGYTSDLKKFIDISGSALMIEGDYFSEAEATVKYIDFNYDVGYMITFETKKDESVKIVDDVIKI